MSAETAIQLWPELRNAVQPPPLERKSFCGRFIVADEWGQLAARVERGEYRLRSPARSKAGLYGPLGGYGTCLAPVMLNDKRWFDPTTEPQDGDFVLVAWSANSVRKIAERVRGDPRLLALYGAEPGDLGVKQLRRFGNDWLLLANDGFARQRESDGGESRVLGVVRYVERNGVPLYGSGELVVHDIVPNAVTDVLTASASSVAVTQQEHSPDGQAFNTTIVSITFTPRASCDVLVSVSAHAAYTAGTSPLYGDFQYSIQQDSAYDGFAEQHWFVKAPASGAEFGVPISTSLKLTVTDGVSTTIKFMAAYLNSDDALTFLNTEMQIAVIKR